MPTAAAPDFPDTEIASYRTGTASLLARSISTTHDIERSLAADCAASELAGPSDLDADPVAPFRYQCTLLLRKARLHSHAAQRANAASNLHSLAVQMRPVLECAGQVVFTFDHLIIAPRRTPNPQRAEAELAGRINADYYDTIIRATKGRVGHEELLANIAGAEEAAAKSMGADTPPGRRAQRLQQTDKVTTLEGGEAWYAHLSKRFCHGEGDLSGQTWHGGVASMNTWRDQLAFAGFLDYLVHQVNTMNAYAALCPTTGGDDRQAWIEATLERLREGRETTAALRSSAVSAIFDGGRPVED